MCVCVYVCMCVYVVMCVYVCGCVYVLLLLLLEHVMRNGDVTLFTHVTKQRGEGWPICAAEPKNNSMRHTACQFTSSVSRSDQNDRDAPTTRQRNQASTRSQRDSYRRRSIETHPGDVATLVKPRSCTAPSRSMFVLPSL